MTKIEALQEACKAEISRQQGGWFGNFLAGRELRHAMHCLVRAWDEIEILSELRLNRKELSTANVAHLLPIDNGIFQPPELTFKIRDEKNGMVYVWSIDLMHGTASGEKWGTIKQFEKWLNTTPYGWEVAKLNRRSKVKV